MLGIFRSAPSPENSNGESLLRTPEVGNPIPCDSENLLISRYNLGPLFLVLLCGRRSGSFSFLFSFLLSFLLSSPLLFLFFVPHRFCLFLHFGPTFVLVFDPISVPKFVPIFVLHGLSFVRTLFPFLFLQQAASQPASQQPANQPASQPGVKRNDHSIQVNHTYIDRARECASQPASPPNQK